MIIIFIHHSSYILRMSEAAKIIWVKIRFAQCRWAFILSLHDATQFMDYIYRLINKHDTLN
jgi:hypothetical protein